MGPFPFDLVMEKGPLPPAGGPTKRRLAVRAIIVRDRRLLMVRSRIVGDWKFPGGGVEPRERPDEALAREIREETGYRAQPPFRPAGRIVERSAGREIPGSRFEMESRYFWAAVGSLAGPLILDEYERDLGFCPDWVAPAEALAANRAVAFCGGADQPPWLDRETRVLELLVRTLTQGRPVPGIGAGGRPGAARGLGPGDPENQPQNVGHVVDQGHVEA